MDIPLLFPKWLALAIASAGAPLGGTWASYHEARIMTHGVPLPPAALTWATKKGIIDPQSIRVMQVDLVPLPAPDGLRRLLGRYGYPTDRVAGLCLNRGIYLHKAVPLSSPILRHELIHTRQYQEAGSIRRFLANYVYQALVYGYQNCPLEVEARTESK